MLRKFHRITGLVMILPFLAWAATGFVFFLKPGYGDAYAALGVKTYPLPDTLSLQLAPQWQEARILATALGIHLLAKDESQAWHHLDIQSMSSWPKPNREQVRRLVEDAISQNPTRYGHIEDIQDLTATTSTGVHITLDWSRLSLYQRGKDTTLIDSLYSIHYLRWTGIPAIDKAWGLIGLALVAGLALSGAYLFRRSLKR